MAKSKKSKSASEDSEKKFSEGEKFIIDPDKGLVFETEEQVFDYFEDSIRKLEKVLNTNRSKEDIPIDDLTEYEDQLVSLLVQPDEVWEDNETIPETPFNVYINSFERNSKRLYYVAMAYMAGRTPSFILLHFPTENENLVEVFRNGKMLFNRANIAENDDGMGDALSDGDELAVGLYNAMLTLRSDTDLVEDSFEEYIQYRGETLSDPDEVWRNTDLKGNVLVNFIKEFQDAEDGDFCYVVVTVEEPLSDSHYLLFSFPSQDDSLVDRYRHGEKVEAEEFVTEESH